MQNLSAMLLAATLLLGFSQPAQANAEGVAARPGWRLVWNDEFNGATLDRTKWRALVPTKDGPGLGNSIFSDTPRHVRVENGVLKLIAYPGPFGRYTSGMLETQNIAAWREGYFEARIKVPEGKGTNAAFWMMWRVPHAEPFPRRGEIDIVEILGREPRRAHGTLHFEGRDKIKNSGQIDAAQPYHKGFHVFAVEWDQGGFAWFVDGVKYHEIRHVPQSDPQRPLYPFDRPFFMMLSNVVGGDWPGPPGWFARWPKTMEVDWVRVYQRDSHSAVQGVVGP